MNALTPEFARAIAAVRRRKEAASPLSNALPAHVVAALGSNTHSIGVGPIGAFNSAHLLEDLLVKYGYTLNAQRTDWQSPHQQSGSYATRVFPGSDGTQYWVSQSTSDAAAGLGKPTSNGTITGDAFDLYVHYEHGDDRAAALTAWNTIQVKPAIDRRQLQRQINAAIGSGSDVVPTAEILPLPLMLERYVYIMHGLQVADLERPQSVLSLEEFKAAYAGSKAQLPAAGGGTKPVPATKVWQEHPDRLTVDVMTFHAGAKRMTVSPKGLKALNAWRPPNPRPAPIDWRRRVIPFVNHIRWLWRLNASTFLDWLAHIEQRPGDLPHFGWIHIAPAHGLGRNWISSVLARLWRGHVAASLDLVDIFEKGFNDRLSECLLAIVDEINEGGNAKYRHADTLRQMVTQEFREINPKYGKRRVEYNATRWLFFSNRTGAIPLDEHDRRFWVVGCDGQPRHPTYYTRLYKLLDDPDFIASVREYLRRRNISKFNPGQRPPMTSAKEALIELTSSEEYIMCKALVSNWPVDIITGQELNSWLPTPVTQTSTRHAMDRATIRKLRKVRLGKTVETVYVLRNHPKWKEKPSNVVRAEVDRVSSADKAKIFGDALP